MSKINLQTLGFTDKFAAEATLYSNLFAGRVTAQYKEFYRVMTEAGELLADLSMKDSRAFRKEIDRICEEVF